MSNEVLLDSSGFGFRYDTDRGFHLKVPDLVIKKGQTVVLRGPSGSGKSTLLKILSGNLPAQFVWQNKQADRPMVAEIPQDLHLVSSLSVMENVLTGSLGRLASFDLSFSPTLKDEAFELLKQLSIENLAEVPVSRISGGQKQRVAIARALMSHAQVICADEPFSSLDQQTAIETYELLKKLQQQRQFALIVSMHNLELVQLKFDQTWYMYKGELVKKEPVFEINDKIVFRNSGQQWLSLVVPAVVCMGFVFMMQGISTSGWNDSQSVVELWNFLKKLFLPASADLAKVSWMFLLERLYVTLQIAVTGTVLGFVLSVPLSFLSVMHFVPSYIAWPVRIFLMMLRSIPSLVWALIFVAGFGLGAVSGILALAVYSVGYLTKWIYESVEDLERKPFLSLRAMGASRWQSFYYSVIPNAKPILVSALVFMLEYNVRSASLLGLVGAGGIGQDLMQSLEWRDFSTTFAILFLLILCVFVFDSISNLLRKKFIKTREG